MQDREASVLGSKVVAPLTDTVGLVNGKQTEQALGVQGIQLCQKTGCVDALWGCIQQGDFAFSQALLNRIGFFAAEGGI